MRQAMLAVVAFCAHAAVAAAGPENWCEAGLATTGCEVFGDTGSMCDDTGPVSVCNCTAGYTSTPPGGPCSSDTNPATTLDISVYFKFDGKDCTSARDYNANSQALRKLIEELTGGTVQGDLITTCDASKPSRGVFAEVLAAPVATLETLDFFASADGKIGSAAMYTPIGALGTLNRANFVTTAMQCSSSFAKKTLIYSEAAICVPITCVNATFVIRTVPRVGGVEEVICGTALLPKLPPVAEKFCGSDAECAKLGDKNATCGTEQVGWCKCNTPGFANRNNTGLCTDEATKDVPMDISMGFPDGNCTEYKASKPQQDAVDNMIKAITNATEIGTQEVICGSVTVLTPVKVPLEKVTTDFNAAAAAEITKPAYAAVKSQGTLEVVPIVTATPCDLAGATKTRQVSGVCQAVECDLTQAFILDASTQLCAPIETSAPTTLPPETPAPPATSGGAIDSWCASDDTCRANGDMNATCGVVDAATGRMGCTCTPGTNFTNTGDVLLCTSPGDTVKMTLSVVFGNADCNTYNNNPDLQAGVKLLMEDSTGGTVESSTVVCGSVSVISQVSGVAPDMLTKDFVTEMTSKLSATPARYGNLRDSLKDVTGGSADTESSPCVVDNAAMTAKLDTVPGKCIALACNEGYVVTTLTDPAENGRTICRVPFVSTIDSRGQIKNWCTTNSTCRTYGDDSAYCMPTETGSTCVCATANFANRGTGLCTTEGQTAFMTLSLEFGNADCNVYTANESVQEGVSLLMEDTTAGKVEVRRHICGSVSVFSRVSGVPVTSLTKNFVTEMRDRIKSNPATYGNLVEALGPVTGGSAAANENPCSLPNAVVTAIKSNVPNNCIALQCTEKYQLVTDVYRNNQIVCQLIPTAAEDDDDDLTDGELAAAIVVPIIVVLLIIGGVVFCLMKRDPSQDAGEPTKTAPDSTEA